MNNFENILHLLFDEEISFYINYMHLNSKIRFYEGLDLKEEQILS